MSARQVSDRVIPIHQIEAEENLGRLENTRVAPEWLVHSIRENGLLHAIVVEQIGKDRYRIVAGQNRLLAVRELGEKYIRASVRTFESEAHARATAIAENVHRSEDFTLYEQTMLVHRLVTKHHLDPSDVCRILRMAKKDLHAMIRAPEVLTPEQMDAFKKCKNKSIARMFLVASMRRSKEQREALLATPPKPEKKFKVQPQSAIIEELERADGDDDCFFRGKPLSHRERAIRSATLSWVLRREKNPFTFHKPRTTVESEPT